MDLIKIAEEAFATGKQHPSFKAGDTVTVAYRIIEGNKERVQLYRGVVIKIAGHGEKKRFTVRKMSGTVGVERIFPIESPAIDSIEVNKVGKVRRAKLYYLRALTGKKLESKKKELTANQPCSPIRDKKEGIFRQDFLFLFVTQDKYHSYLFRQKDAKSYKIESLYSPFKQFANHPFLKQRASVDLFA